jgi:hypothetical protein
LPVSSQRRAIVLSPHLSTCLEASGRGTASPRSSNVPAKSGRYTGEIASGQGNETRYSNLTIDEFCE